MKKGEVKIEEKKEGKKMVEPTNTEGAAKVDKGSKFKCLGCGRDWEHKVKKTSGLCKDCVEIRRGLQSFINGGRLSLTKMKERLPKIIETLTGPVAKAK